MPRPGLSSLLLSWAAFALPGGVGAQVTPPDSLKDEYRLPVPTAEQARSIVVQANTGLAAGTTLYSTGNSLGIFVGATYTRVTRYVEGDHDGTGIIGVGFGNPATWLGVSADLMFYSTLRSGLLNRMGLDLSLHRYLPGDFLLTVGWENFMARGIPDSGESHFGILSRWFRLRDPDRWFSYVNLAVGAGDGRFVSEEDWLQGNTDEINLFGSISIQIAPPVTFIADWGGDDLTLGVSILPFPNIPFVITPAVADVTGQISSGARFVVTAGYLVSLGIS